VNNLEIEAGSFSLGSADVVGKLSLDHSALVTTSHVANIGQSLSLYAASALSAGADLKVAESVYLSDGSTLEMNSHAIEADGLYVDDASRIFNRGTIKVRGLSVRGGSLLLGSADVAGSLSLSNGAAVTTSHVGNISSGAGLSNTSTLNLGADLKLSGWVDVYGGATLNMNAHGLEADGLTLLNASGIVNPGTIKVNRLAVWGGSLSLGSADVADTVNLYNNASLTTSSLGNIASYASLYDTSTLSLGTDLKVGSDVNLYSGATLNMNAHRLEAAKVWVSDPSGIVNRGTLKVGRLDIERGSFSLGSADVVGTLSLPTSAAVTTSNPGNIGVSVAMGGTSALNLGADLKVSNTVQVSGSATLNMNSFGLEAAGLYIDNGLLIANPGAIKVGQLWVRGGSFPLGSADVVGGLYLFNSAVATTSNAGNITSYMYLYDTSTLNAGADLKLSSVVGVTGSAKLNMNSHRLDAAGLSLDDALGIVNPGTIKVQDFQLKGGSFSLGSADVVGKLTLDNSASLTTSHVGNIASDVSLKKASTLNLGADLKLSGNLGVNDSATLNMNAHGLEANSFWFQNASRVVHQGTINVGFLQAGGGFFSLGSADVVTSLLFVFNDASLTTSSVGNIPQSAYVDKAATLSLGADLKGNGSIYVTGGGTLSANSHGLEALRLQLGDASGAGTLLNAGTVSVKALILDGGSSPVFGKGADVYDAITITRGASLTVQQQPGSTTGLTLHNSSFSALTIGAGSVLALAFAEPLQEGSVWAFRWQGDHLGDLQAMAGDGRLTWQALFEVSVFDAGDGYTYVGNPHVVPEPSTMVGLGTLGLIGLVLARRRALAPRRPGTDKRRLSGGQGGP